MITSCEEYGGYIDEGSDGTVINNTSFMKNTYGLRVKSVQHCQFNHNLFKENDLGVFLCCGSTNNTFSLNAFVNNNIQAVDDYQNFWSKNDQGNYWSDFETLYPSASHGDTFWNTPYVLYENLSLDTFPLVNNPLN